MLRRTLLRIWLVLALLVSAAAGEAPLPASKPAVKGAIVAVIEAQLTAFRAGDVAKAYGYAAAELRAQKPQPAFAVIVEASYPEIWRSERAEFGIVRDDGRRATVTVQVFGKESAAAYDYTLAKETDGWRIIGVLRHTPRKTGKA
ncbi:MAG: DUF4864 domain-containing protein [Opitutaceae bacterium]|nr:DUF4864 domain-containing protein [Opitutaceae bacterium]